VSATRGEGRSTLTANVGIALADSGLSTLLIDADSATGGLSRLLQSRFKLKAARDRVRVDLAAAGMSLDNVIRSGDPQVRLAVLRVGRLQRSVGASDRESQLHELESAFNVVIIDAPPLSDSGPYWPLMRRADGALVLVTDNTAVAELEEVSRLLGAIGMTAFGYVYSHVPRPLRVAWTAEKAVSPVSPSAPAGDLSESA
jgi:Mrp family chromosome partitioning ATPase